MKYACGEEVIDLGNNWALHATDYAAHRGVRNLRIGHAGGQYVILRCDQTRPYYPVYRSPLSLAIIAFIDGVVAAEDWAEPETNRHHGRYPFRLYAGKLHDA